MDGWTFPAQSVFGAQHAAALDSRACVSTLLKVHALLWLDPLSVCWAKYRELGGQGWRQPRSVPHGTADLGSE